MRFLLERKSTSQEKIPCYDLARWPVLPELVICNSPKASRSTAHSMNSLFKGSSSPRVVVCPRRSRPARAALRRMLSSFLAVMCLAPLARSQPDGALAPWARDILNYGIIIDAGSGGSRIHIYQWRPRVFTSI